MVTFAHATSQPPSQKLHLRAQPQKHHPMWLGKCVTPGMHIVAHSGQILKTRTVTRLIKEQQFNSVEQNHSSTSRMSTWLSVTIKNSRNRIALQELIRSFIKQQKSKMLSKDFMPMDQSFEVTVEHAGSPLMASAAEGATQPSSTSLPPSSSTATSRQPQHLNQQHLR